MFEIIFIDDKENSHYAIVRKYKNELIDSYQIIKYFENMSEAKDFLFEMDILRKNIYNKEEDLDKNRSLCKTGG